MTPTHTAENIPSNIDLSEQFLHALHIMEETDKNVFITGRAGTGKSTLLQHFRDTKRLKRSYPM